MDTSLAPLPALGRRSVAAALVLALVASLLALAPQAAEGSSRFVDVATTSPHATAIEQVARARITQGCRTDRYCPEQALTRGQAAALIARLLGAPDRDVRGVFRDVDPSSTHAGSIAALAERGILLGCADDAFCPSQRLTRAQMASVLTRAFDLHPSRTRVPFRDVAPGVHASAIQALADAGVTVGCGGGRFCPNAPVTRAQFASFLYRVASDAVDAAARRHGGSGSSGSGSSSGGSGEVAPVAGDHLLYDRDDVTRFRSAMSQRTRYFSVGDAGHGGPYSPGDGARSLQLAEAFLADPRASHWVQPDLPYSPLDPWPRDLAYARPLHAAWVYLTVPDHPRRADLERELKALLLSAATHPSHDYANATNYPVDYAGYAPSPIFDTAHWVARLLKVRDMLGRDVFTASENRTLDRWFYDYANWSFQWLHREAYGRKLPGREQRDYSRINMTPDASRRSYDGGPLIGSLARAYTNRHATVVATASLAANYLAFHDYGPPTTGGPAYGRWTLDRLLLHSQLFVEETIRFSVYPQGFQGDFERGDRRHHPNATPQHGWSYSANVLANLVDVAEYHARRGDHSLFAYQTTAGFDGTAGAPDVGGFRHKSLHFYAWAMSRYVNDAWGRRNDGQRLALPHFYHDVLPAAIVAERTGDPLLRDAWRRQGSGFPPYPERPQSQGMWPAHLGEGAKTVGLLELVG